jgi:hypothetical protein
MTGDLIERARAGDEQAFRPHHRRRARHINKYRPAI